MVALHNFSGEPATVDFSLADAAQGDVLVDLLTDDQQIAIGERGEVSVQLDGYGFRWYRLIRPTGKRLG
jgi:hypothetical protein